MRGGGEAGSGAAEHDEQTDIQEEIRWIDLFTSRAVIMLFRFYMKECP